MPIPILMPMPMLICILILIPIPAPMPIVIPMPILTPWVGICQHLSGVAAVRINYALNVGICLQIYPDDEIIQMNLVYVL